MTATVPSRDELQDHRPSGASQGPRPAPMFELIPYEKFRDTPSVRFFDITVPSSNKRDPFDPHPNLQLLCIVDRSRP